MKILLNLDDFDTRSSRELIPLECEHCHKIFHSPKNKIQAVIKNTGFWAGKLRFCSSSCCAKSTHRRKIIHCSQCGKEKELILSRLLKRNFCSRTCSARYNGVLQKKPKSVKPIKLPKIKKPLIEKLCSNCHKTILRTQRDIDNSKSGTFFCQKSCKTKYANQYQIIHKPKSRAEILLVKLIKDKFPNLEVQENVRSILKSKLEIDIFIPSLKLAIELNGPVHYIPMYGQEKLNKVKNKDLLKQAEINQLGFNLIIIDISQLNSRKSTDNFIVKYFNEYIFPILS